MIFEWDPAKRTANLAKHGLDLTVGAALFDGRMVYTYPSPRAEEPRWVTIGRIEEILVALVWTDRGGTARLISLRRARNAEKSAYHARFG